MMALLLLGGAMLPAVAHAEQPDGEVQLAARGPIIWHVQDEEKRKRMENDLELLRLYNEAMAAKNKRKTLGKTLFYPGAILIGAGFAAGLFQNAIGLYDSETGEYLMVGGVALGAALAGPGLYFTAHRSEEERRYEDYMMKMYQEKPIMFFMPLPGNGLALGVAVPF